MSRPREGEKPLGVRLPLNKLPKDPRPQHVAQRTDGVRNGVEAIESIIQS